MNASHDYTVVYGVGLLDDAHNYFPALLYDQQRFHTLADIFAYVRMQMNTRFNLFSYGNSLYNRSAAARAGAGAAAGSAAGPVGAPGARVAAAAAAAAAAPIPGFLQGMGQFDVRNMQVFGQDDTFSAAHLILSMFGELPRGDPTFRQPVVVRPTQEVLNTSTREIPGSELPVSSRCAICQDSIVINDMCRRILHCGHTYHKTCIDQWFDRSVFCPTCRHDIRTPLGAAIPEVPVIAEPVEDESAAPTEDVS